jgi:hypothetical protein
MYELQTTEATRMVGGRSTSFGRNCELDNDAEAREGTGLEVEAVAVVLVGVEEEGGVEAEMGPSGLAISR